MLTCICVGPPLTEADAMMLDLFNSADKKRTLSARKDFKMRGVTMPGRQVW